MAIAPRSRRVNPLPILYPTSQQVDSGEEMFYDKFVHVFCLRCHERFYGGWQAFQRNVFVISLKNRLLFNGFDNVARIKHHRPTLQTRPTTTRVKPHNVFSIDVSRNKIAVILCGGRVDSFFLHPILLRVDKARRCFGSRLECCPPRSFLRIGQNFTRSVKTAVYCETKSLSRILRNNEPRGRNDRTSLFFSPR